MISLALNYDASFRHTLVTWNAKRFVLVIDLNGIFCKCHRIEHEHNISPSWLVGQIMPDKMPAMIKSKFGIPWLGYKAFWRFYNFHVYVCIWSSMHIDNIKMICDYLFVELPQPLYMFIEQHCSKYVDFKEVEFDSPDDINATLYHKNLDHTCGGIPRSFHNNRLFASLITTLTKSIHTKTLFSPTHS